MNALAYGWIVRRRILTAGRGVPWLLLVAACTAVALTLDPDSLPVSFHPGPAFQCLAGLVGSSAIAAFAPCAFLAFKGNRSLDVAAASRPIGRLERAAGAAAGSLAAAAAIAAAFAAPLVVTSNFDGQVRARTATCAVHPDVMRRPGDSVSLENPVGGEFQLFPEVGLTRGYGAGEPALIELTGERAPRAYGVFELGVGEPPRIGGPPGPVKWTLTHAGGPLPVYWPPGSAVALGGVMGTRRTLALLFVQLLTYLFLLAGASAAFGLLLEAPVASLGAAVVWLVSLTSTLPEPLAPLNLTNYVDVQSLTKGLVAPVDAKAAALAASTVVAALVAAGLVRRRVR